MVVVGKMEHILLLVILIGLCAMVQSQVTPSTNCTDQTAKCAAETRTRFDAAGGVVSSQCSALYYGLNCLGKVSASCTDPRLVTAIADARKELNGLSCQATTTTTAPWTTKPNTRAISRWGRPQQRGRDYGHHAYGSVSCVTNSVLVLLSAFVLSIVV